MAEEASLRLNADLSKLLQQIDQLADRVGELEGNADAWRRTAGKGFEETANSAKTLNAQIAITSKTIKALEKDQREMNEIRKAGGRIDEKVYARVNADLATYRGNLAKLKTQLASVKTETSEVGSVSEKAFNKINTYLTLAAVGYAGKQMIDLAVSLDVVQAKADTVFGEWSRNLDEVAAKTSKTLGMSRAEYKRAASAIGDLLVPMKFTREEAFVMSTGIMSLAGALSEWTGGTRTSTEVSQIFVKAMLGEREMLKELGIKFDETDIKAKLLSKGQSNLTGEMLKQAEAIATLELIQERSLDAQSRFAQGQDSLRRNAAILRANFQELRDTLATELIPSFLRFFSFVNNNLPAIMEFARWITVLTVGIVTYRKAVELATWATKTFNLTMKATPWGLALGALTALGTAILSYRIGTNKATDAQKGFNAALIETEEIKNRRIYDDLTDQVQDFGKEVEQVQADIIAKLNGEDLTLATLGGLRTYIEGQIKIIKATLAKAKEELAKNPESKSLQVEVEVNEAALANLRAQLDTIIRRVAEMTKTEVDLSTWKNWEIIQGLEELAKVREDLLTDEQKELKKALEFELKLRQEAFNKRQAIYADDARLAKAKEDLQARWNKEMEAQFAAEAKAAKTIEDAIKLVRERLDENSAFWVDAIRSVGQETKNSFGDGADAITDYANAIIDATKAFNDYLEAWQDGEEEVDDFPKALDEAAKAAKKLNDEIAKWQGDNTFWAALGFTNQDQVNAFKDSVNSIIDSTEQLIQNQIDSSDRIIEVYNNQISEVMSLLEQEAEFKAAGLSNDYELQKKNLEELQRLRDEELKEKQKWVKAQQIMNTLLQASELATAAAKLISTEASKGIVGVVLAIGGLALLLSLYSTFVSSSKEAAASSMMEKGGKIKGPRHSEGGIRIPGTNIEVEGDEFVTNRRSTAKYEPLLKAINMDSPAAIKIAMEKQQLTSNMLVVKEKDIDDSKKLQRIIDLLGKDNQFIAGDGWYMERHGNYTKKVFLN